MGNGAAVKDCSWCQDPTSGWELGQDGIFHPGSQGMESRDEGGQGCHTLASTGMDPGILDCPQDLGMVLPMQHPGLGEAFRALSVPMDHGQIPGDMETPPWGISSSWQWFSIRFFPLSSPDPTEESQRALGFLFSPFLCCSFLFP